MSKLTIQIATLNVYLGGAKAASNSGVDSLLGALIAGSVFGADEKPSCDESTCDESTCDESTCGQTESTVAAASETGLAQSVSNAAVLHSAMVMTTQHVDNSSTGLELTDTRKQGNAVAVSSVYDNQYVVVQAASAAGEALKALGLIETTGYVNKYYKSGNFGKTVHATMDKADEYSDGDCVAVEVFVAYASSFKRA